MLKLNRKVIYTLMGSTILVGGTQNVYSAEGSSASGQQSQSTTENLLVRNEFGQSPLHLAAKAGDLERVKFLLENAPDFLNEPYIRTIEEMGRETPLHYAARSGNVDICALLIKAAPQLLENSLVKNGSGQTPLHIAAMISNPDVAIYLIKNAPQLTSDSLMMDNGGHTNKYIQNNPDEKVGHSPLYYALITSNTKMLIALANAAPQLLKMPVNLKNGYTALHQAANMGNLEAVKFLAENAPWLFQEPFLRSANGKTFIQIAQENGHNNIVEAFS